MRDGLLFRIALLLKGIDGAFELVGAIVLLIIPTGTVQTLINDVLARDLLGPPDGSLAKRVRQPDVRRGLPRPCTAS